MDRGQMNFKAILKQIFGENLNKEYKLTGSQLMIGRHPKCQIQITSPSISRKHCVLTSKSNGWSVKDNKSQNGTYINGRQLKQGEEYLLQYGDIIFLGPPSNSSEEVPQAFSYEELIGNESDDDIVELPLKCASEPNSASSSKKTTLNIPCSTNGETLKRQSSPSAEYVTSDSENKFVPPAPKKNRSKSKMKVIPSTLQNATDISNFSNSAANISSSLESQDNGIEMNIDNVEQFYEISSTNNYEYDNSESLLHTEFQYCDDENEEVFKKENNEKDSKEKDLELKLALLSEEVKALQASKIELLKNYKDVCEKNKVLDKELVDKQSKMEKELQMHEVKAKNEVKSELLEKFEEDLVCNICTELFIKPTVLDCSHTFCEYCIKEWRKKKNDCPICRCKIKNITQVRTLEQFIDKTLATLTPDQKLKRANVIADRKAAQRPPVNPPDLITGHNVTPRRRRGSHRHRNRHYRAPSNPGNGSIQVLHESGRPDYSHTIYHLTPGTTESPMNFVDLTSMGISVIFN